MPTCRGNATEGVRGVDRGLEYRLFGGKIVVGKQNRLLLGGGGGGGKINDVRNVLERKITNNEPSFPLQALTIDR
jgi:hypothetical protein